MLEVPAQKLNVVLMRQYQDAKEALILKWLLFDLTGEHTIITCKHCKKQTTITFPFVPFSIWVESGTRKARTKMLNTKKDAIKHFQELHWESCIKFKG